MGASNSATPPRHYSSQETVASEDLSLSVVSIDDTIDSFDDQDKSTIYAQGDGSRSRNEVFTLVTPVVSEKLIQAQEEQGIYVSGSASFKLDSTSQQKKKTCGCCCGRRKSDMNEVGSYESFDTEYPPTEIITLKSDDDLLIKPKDVYPLSKVASLDMTASQVRKSLKKNRRTQVPEKPDRPMSLWGLIKSAIGKDLTKMPLPVNFSEPLSILQRLTEDYEYSHILDRASHMQDSLEQLASVAAFTISAYATCAYRTAKPFNPLLGETYECDRTDDLGWRVIAEQVCHHPPIATLHCESAFGWVHWQQFTMKSNFRGTYLEIIPLGVAHLRFKRGGNHYTWRKVSTIVRNLYMGKLYIEQEGEMDIFNHTTSEKCHLKYTSGGMFSRDRSVTGTIYNKANEPKWEIRGEWDSEVVATRLDDKGKPSGESKMLWVKNPILPEAEARYFFSVFACQLNEPEEEVAPTDSRNRPDQRFMENGLWDEANAEKLRLEEKQRETRKMRLAEATATFSTSSKLTTKSVKSTHNSTAPEDGVEPYYTPAWFVRQRDPLSGQYIYMYSGEYWPCKEAQDWDRCPNIFDK